MVDHHAHASSSHWERQAIQKLLMSNVIEQRRARRWGIFFKLVFIVLAGIILYSIFNRELPQPVMTTQAHTAMIDIRGEIGEEQDASADNVRVALKTAYQNKNVKGVILRINSPGGSPVQARYIYDEMMNLRKQNPNIKIYVAIEEIGASAAYLIASAADAIYADQTSLVGSIGVKMEGFGFVDAMQKVGVERRFYSAGKNKGFLDPFLPRSPQDEAFIQEQLNLVHQAFIKNVKDGRGQRLKETPDIFSGLVWCGEQALQLGLIDGFGDGQYIAKELIKVDNIVDYTPTATLLDRLANRIGASMGRTLLKAGFKLG